MPQLEHIEAIEKRLWSAADNLRANSNYASNEYFLPVMGLVFLRHAYSRYLAVKARIEPNRPSRGGKTKALTKEDFSQESAIFLRPKAQFDHLVALPDSEDRARAIIEAMDTIEADYENLRGVLPKGEFQELDNQVLGQLLRTLNPEELKKVSGDVFGRIYEYFLTQFAGQGEGGATDPARPDEELLADLAEAISLVRAFLEGRGTALDDVIQKTGFERNAAIVVCKEAANENDESRKRFEVMCREVFKKFKACINVQGINAYRSDRDAINIIYKSLQQDREQADITDIIKQLHLVVNDAIDVRSGEQDYPSSIYDISKIDFDRLRKEFERSPTKNTTVQNLRQVVEQRLQRLLLQNPLRTDFQQHYENIVSEYNREKDRVTIEKTFEALFKLDQELNEEERRAIREGLDEESLAIFDLLKKPDLKSAEIKRIKTVAADLLARLKAEKLRIDHWRDKEATRDAVRVTIHDYLWTDKTGLPVDVYTEDDVNERADDVFRHVYRAYPTLPSPYYTTATT